MLHTQPDRPCPRCEMLRAYSPSRPGSPLVSERIPDVATAWRCVMAVNAKLHDESPLAAEDLLYSVQVLIAANQ